MINFDEFDMANEGATTHVVPIVAEVPQDIDDADLQANSKLDLAILPLRNVVLFPGMTMPVSIGRDKSMRLVKEAVNRHVPIGVVCQIDSKADNPGQNDLYTMGTVASIIKVLQLPDGGTNVILHGRSSFVLNQITQEEPYLRGTVTLTDIELPRKGDKEFAVVMASVKEITLKILANMGDNGQEMAFALSNIDSPFFMINYLANNIPFEAKQKQQLLEERNLRQRAFMLYSMLRQEE